jgi:hypothetical protein
LFLGNLPAHAQEEAQITRAFSQVPQWEQWVSNCLILRRL